MLSKFPCFESWPWFLAREQGHTLCDQKWTTNGEFYLLSGDFSGGRVLVAILSFLTALEFSTSFLFIFRNWYILSICQMSRAVFFQRIHYQPTWSWSTHRMNFVSHRTPQQHASIGASGLHKQHQWLVRLFAMIVLFHCCWLSLLWYQRRILGHKKVSFKKQCLFECQHSLPAMKVDHILIWLQESPRPCSLTFSPTPDNTLEGQKEQQVVNDCS